MTKYKGLDNGRERGEYKHALLVVENVSKIASPDKDHPLYAMEEHIRKSGEIIPESICLPDGINEIPWKGFVGHYGGSTVCCRWYYKPPNDGIILELISNDDMSDVKRKLIKKFPYLVESDDEHDIVWKPFD